MFKYGDIVRVKHSYIKPKIGGEIGIIKDMLVDVNGKLYMVEFEGRTDLHGGNVRGVWFENYKHEEVFYNRWWVEPHYLEIIDINRDPYEDWIEWEEDVNEEYNHEIDEFELGDNVIINDYSVHKLQGYDKNGVRLVGEIINTYLHSEYKYGVQWNNNTSNGYRRVDLILFNRDPYEDWIDWEEDWEEDVNENTWGQTTEPGPLPDYDFYTTRNNDVISKMNFNTGYVVKGTQEKTVSSELFQTSILDKDIRKKRKKKSITKKIYPRDNVTSIIKFKEFVKENHGTIASNTMGFSSPGGNGMYTNPPGEVTAALFGTGDYIAGSVTNIISDPYFNFKNKLKRKKIRRNKKYKYNEPESEIEKKKKI
jgi:hypothetical protein